MENDSMTPSVLRYSDQIPQMSPQMDLNYLTMIPSNGATFSASQNVRIPINVPTDSFVDMKRAYIKFKITNPVAAGANDSSLLLDPVIGAASIISTFRVVSGTGALLEEIQHYDALCAIMNNHKNADVRQSRTAITMGGSQTPMTAESISVNAGYNAGNAGGRQTIAGTHSKVFYHEPVSAVFNADKLMPFGYTQGTSYIELTLNSATGGVTQFANASNAATAWTASEWELYLPVLRPGAEFANNFRTLIQSGLPINIHSVGFQNSQQNIAENATGLQTITFSTRKRSVKSVMTALRINGQLSLITCNSSSGFKHNDAVDYQYSVGGRRIPSAPIKVSAETNGLDLGGAFNNTLMALGHYDSNLRGASCDVTTQHRKYMQNVADDNDRSSSVAFSLDLEQYGEGLSGMNLAGQGLPLVLHLNCGAGGARASTVGALLADLYIVHDVIFTLDGVSGTMSASS
tara:strand:+ start:1755 stop:3137 length:1383 start_codon:yes stop_codon:yes gene_type:complete